MSGKDIYILETAGGNLIDVISDESLIKYAKSPHYILYKDVEPLQKRLKELGYDKMSKQVISQIISEGFIKVNNKVDDWD